jgi:hypothetical protein
MLWPSDKYNVAFSKIVEDALQGGTTILMLVAPEPDAVASHLILKRLLKAEDVQFQVRGEERRIATVRWSSKQQH